ncbi:hypothetical protein LPJ61_003674 [Coemansia biformis]|uniref:FAD dependent oxidoreductase domain-containing protein n=1 Tax=Coemansia biformis TaxID=1286918 RepID=A0A9W7YCJ7_9FUNG|nr:hypothetical protein LPJ61_003674 [Coemansia biformis]
MALVPVVVVGCGVIGLTTALSLQRSGRYSVTVVAREAPGAANGESQEWASPYAGANWRPYAPLGDAQQRAAEEATYFRLRDIAASQPAAGVRVATMRDFGASPHDRVPSFLGYVHNLRRIPSSEWPEHAQFGYAYDSLIVDVPRYLLWLRQEFCSRGGIVRHGALEHICNAPRAAGVQVAAVINCTGLGSRALGINDATMFPTRGQTLLVRAPSVEYTTTAPGARSDRATYVIPRGDGTVIIGGVFEQGCADASEDPLTTEEILRNCIALCPQLLDRGFESLRHPSQVPACDVEQLRCRAIRVNVGFRPSRRDGPRLEVEHIGGLTVLHNYGHSSFGYQTSWGYAGAAVRLLDSALGAAAKL